MLIRPATSADIPALLGLLQTLFALEADFDFDREKSTRGLQLMLGAPEQRTILVGEVAGEVAGMCSAQLIISTAMGTPAVWIEDVVLRPEYRGHGLMPLLLAHLERWATQRGAARFQVLCDAHNAPAMAFYPKVGFYPTQLIGFFKHPAATTP